MLSLLEVENRVLARLMRIRHIDNTSKYKALLESSIARKAGGCDGFIMMEVQAMLEKILRACSREELTALYHETPAGHNALAHGLGEPDQDSMIQDTAMELLLMIIDSICAEARERLSPTRKQA